MNKNITIDWLNTIEVIIEPRIYTTVLKINWSLETNKYALAIAGCRSMHAHYQCPSRPPGLHVFHISGTEDTRFLVK